MNEGLLPCPFCGSRNLHEAGISGCHYISCGDCEAEGPLEESYQLSAKAWNSRPLVNDAPASVPAERNEGEDTSTKEKA